MWSWLFKPNIFRKNNKKNNVIFLKLILNIVMRGNKDPTIAILALFSLFEKEFWMRYYKRTNNAQGFLFGERLAEAWRVHNTQPLCAETVLSLLKRWSLPFLVRLVRPFICRCTYTWNSNTNLFFQKKRRIFYPL